MAGQDPNNPGMVPGMMPGMMPGQMPGMMPGQMPGMMPGQVPGMFGNPMMQMMQMMQMMMGGAPAMPVMDPSAMPFAVGNAPQDADRGLDSDIIRPATLKELVRKQVPIP